MYKKITILTLMLGISTVVLAKSYETLGLGFAAPVVADRGSVTNEVVGEIVYDVSDNSFYGWTATSSPAWVKLGGATVASTQSARIAGTTETTGCTSGVGNCNVYRETENWISAVTWNSLGNVTLTIQGFTSTPTCVCSAKSAVNRFCFADVTSVTSVTLTQSYPSNTTGSTAPDNGIYDIICNGN